MCRCDPIVCCEYLRRVCNVSEAGNVVLTLDEAKYQYYVLCGENAGPFFSREMVSLFVGTMIWTRRGERRALGRRESKETLLAGVGIDFYPWRLSAAIKVPQWGRYYLHLSSYIPFNNVLIRYSAFSRERTREPSRVKSRRAE